MAEEEVSAHGGFRGSLRAAKALGIKNFSRLKASRALRAVEDGVRAWGL